MIYYKIFVLLLLLFVSKIVFADIHDAPISKAVIESDKRLGSKVDIAYEKIYIGELLEEIKKDERLRDRRVDLVGTRKKAAPYLQVLMIFVFDDSGTRQYMDYWCDVCSIPMYEIKPCDCCQAEIRFRTQPQELPTFVKQPAKK